MELIIIMSLFFVFIGFCFFMIARAHWVYDRQIEWNQKVYDMRSALIGRRDYKTLVLYGYDELFGSIMSFNKMMLYFWRFDLKKMVVDLDKFNFVINGGRP